MILKRKKERKTERTRKISRLLINHLLKQIRKKEFHCRLFYFVILCNQFACKVLCAFEECFEKFTCHSMTNTKCASPITCNKCSSLYLFGFFFLFFLVVVIFLHQHNANFLSRFFFSKSKMLLIFSSFN